MSSHEQPVRAEDLLADDRWYRAVALRLAGAEDGADDLVQETALAAIQGAPPQGSALKGWLRGAMRNLALVRYRSEARRRRRERLVAREEAVYSAPEDVLVRAELRARVVEAVLGLKDPYLSAILLRYFEGLSHAEIASRAEVPESTVRTWLNRAVGKLRSTLDRSHGGDRPAWLLPLAAGLGLGVSPTLEAAATATTTAGALGTGGTSASTGVAGSGSALSGFTLGGSFLMQKAIVAFSVSCALVVGLGVGFFVGSPDQDSRALEEELISREEYEDLQDRYGEAIGRIASLEKSSSQVTAAREEKVEERRPNSSGTKRGPGPLIPVEFPTGQYESLADVLAAMTRPEYEKGEGAITGQILDYTTQEPMAGVLVRASPSIYWEKTSSGFAAPRQLGKDLESSLRDWASKEHYEGATTVDVHSDASGIFEMTRLHEDRLHTITAHLDGYEIEAAPGFDGEDVRPGAHVRFLAKRVVTFAVRVQFEDGTRPTKSRIYWIASRGTRKWDTWYAHDPEISLRPDSYRLQAKAGSAGEFKSEQSEAILVQPRSPPAEVVLTLKERKAVLGRLVFSAEQTPVSAFVYLVRASTGGPAERELLMAKERRLAHSRDNFTFRFTDIANGAYSIAASRDGAVIDVADTVEIVDGITDIDLELPDLPAESFTTVRVVDPGDESVADARVSVRYPNGFTSGIGAAIRDTHGTFWVLNNRGGDGEHVVQANSIRYGTRSVPFLPGTREVVVRFDDPGRLEVTVEGYVGSGLEGRLQVQVTPTGEHAATPVSSMPLFGRGGLGGNGTQLFEPLEPGTYDVTLGFLAGRLRRQNIGAVRVDVRRGDNYARLRIPAFHTLAIRAPNLPGATRVVLVRRSDGAPYGSSIVRPDGAAGFDYLPEGTYELLYEANGETRRIEIAVPSGGPVVLE